MINRFLIISIVFILSLTANAGLVVIGNIPGEYLKTDEYGKPLPPPDQFRSYLGFLATENRVITQIGAIQSMTLDSVVAKFQSAGDRVVILKRGDQFDTIYPGLIDLHGHNKQNVLPTWTTAKGRYANRYEWRESSAYPKVQRFNMNPWIGMKPATIAAFRWSELQSMILGTTYLQGHIQNDKGFAIHSVEDPGAYISQRTKISGNGDIIDPAKWSFVWNVLRYEMNKLNCENSYQCFQKSVQSYLQQHCQIKEFTNYQIDRQILVLDVARGENTKNLKDIVQQYYGNWNALGIMLANATLQKNLLDHFDLIHHRVKILKAFNPLVNEKTASEYYQVKLIEREGKPNAKEWARKKTFEWIYEQYIGAFNLAFKDVIVGIPQQIIDAPVTALAVKWLGAAEKAFANSCTISDQEEMVTFFGEQFGNNPYKEIVSRNRYLDDPQKGAIITHIGEGRRLDPVTWTEFQLMKLVGWAREGMNFIHGVGLTKADFKYMADQNMGLIWSPYSNFLLYGETVDIAAALDAGVRVSLGSDWTPTGSKSVLEELKLAVEYLEKIGKPLTDRDLYYMVTKNSAITMNHFGYESDEERGVGTLEVGAMATFIAVNSKDPNPYTNLVRKAQAQDVNLVAIDGVPVFGNRSYMEDYDADRKTELITGLVFAETLEQYPESFPPTQTNKTLMTQLVAEKAKRAPLQYSTACGFEEPKVFAPSQSDDSLKHIIPIKEALGIDLETYEDIVRFLGVAMLSQSANVEFDGIRAEYKEGAVTYMPPLYSCEDPTYTQYFESMIDNTGSDDILQAMAFNREANRIEEKLTTRFTERSSGESQFSVMVPHRLAILYKLLPELTHPAPGQEFQPIVEVELSSSSSF